MPDRPAKPPPASTEREGEGAPHHTPRTKAAKAARQARLAAEMRQNLLKRKRQQRARSRTPPGD